MTTEVNNAIIELQNSKVTILQKEYIVEFYLSADQKFLHILLGLGGPCSEFFCPWCECTKKDRGNLLKSKDAILRILPSNIVDAMDWSKGGTKRPLFTHIDFDKIVPDILHLRIRTVEKLVQLLYKDICVNKDRDLLSEFTEKLKEIINRPSFKWSTKGKNYTIRPRFDGIQCNSILKNYKELTTLIPNFSSNGIQCCQYLYEINLAMTAVPQEEIPLLLEKIEKWGKCWNLAFGSPNFINSCHVIYCHLPFYITRYGGLNRFSQQGTERGVGEKKSVEHSITAGNSDGAATALSHNNRQVSRISSTIKKKKKITCCGLCGSYDHVRLCKKCPKFKEKK